MKKRLVYFHWNEEEAKENIKKIKIAGYAAELGVLKSQTDFKTIRTNPPDVFIIDLSRLPSHGKEVGFGLRSYKSTSQVPIIFLGGEKEKVNKIKSVLPDAVYCSWNNLKTGIANAEKVDRNKIKPAKNILDAYSNTPLPQKLGIRESISVGLIDAPRNLKNILGELPANVKLIKKPKEKLDLVLMFTLFMSALESNFEVMNEILSEKGSVWIFWPKKTSKVNSDLSQQEVRNYGLARGFVDYKVCSFDETWSGLKFSRRKK